MASRSFSGPARLAWLLVSSRLHAADPALTSRSGFLAQLKATGVKADPTRLSRWESGAAPVPLSVVAAYEEVVGAQPGVFQAIAQRLAREQGEAAAMLGRGEPLTHTELDALFDTVDAGACDGHDWLRLANGLTATGRAYLHHHTWEHVARTLIGELTRSTGPALLRRYEAATLLIQHQDAQRFVTRALGEHVTADDVQLVAPAVTLLREIDSPGVSDLVVRLGRSEHPLVRSAALSTLAAKIRNGHVAHQDLRDLEPALWEVVRPQKGGVDITKAADLITQLSDPAFERLTAAVDDNRVRKQLEEVRRSGELLSADVTRPLSRTVAGLVQRTVTTNAHVEPDAMLQRLVREGLFHHHRGRRILASTLLAASPFRDAVADCCVEIARDRKELLGARGWFLLKRLGLGSRRVDVVDFALSSHHEPTQEHALLALGAAPRRLSPGEGTAVEEVVRSDAKTRVRRAALYALGMNDPDRAARLGDDHTLPGQLQRAADWWRRSGPAIHEHLPTTAT